MYNYSFNCIYIYRYKRLKSYIIDSQISNLDFKYCLQAFIYKGVKESQS